MGGFCADEGYRWIEAGFIGKRLIKRRLVSGVLPVQKAGKNGR